MLRSRPESFYPTNFALLIFGRYLLSQHNFRYIKSGPVINVKFVEIPILLRL